MLSQLVVVGKPLARVRMIRNKFSILEGVSICYLNHITICSGIVIKSCEFDQSMALT